MTNPTSNFGWQMPTGTDLLVDLPADFETFGQAVDTSMADLKGGTTGQVLAKASGTDMDFTWTTAGGGNPATYNVRGTVYGTMGTSGNTGLGLNVLEYNTAGYGNTAVGAAALNGNNGSNNTAVGENTGVNSSGSNNIFLGNGVQPSVYNVNNEITIGNATNNRFRIPGLGIDWTSSTVPAGATAATFATRGTVYGTMGTRENTGLGLNVLEYNTSGVQNVAVGAGSLNGNNGNGNTAVGTSTGTNSSGSNNIFLGNGVQPSVYNVSNEITLGNSSISALRCQVTSITSLSDARDKKNVEPLSVGLDFVKELKPVTFDWNMRPDENSNGAVGKVDVPDMGFIAQDLVAAEDATGLTDHVQLTYRNNPEKLEASQGRLIPILVKAIQDLAAQNEALAARVTALESK